MTTKTKIIIVETSLIDGAFAVEERCVAVIDRVSHYTLVKALERIHAAYGEGYDFSLADYGAAFGRVATISNDTSSFEILRMTYRSF